MSISVSVMGFKGALSGSQAEEMANMRIPYGNDEEVCRLFQSAGAIGRLLEEQGGEWAIIASRGGSAAQLIYIQFVTVAILGVIAFFAGPLLAQLILVILAAVGPQAAILNAPDITSDGGGATARVCLIDERCDAIAGLEGHVGDGVGAAGDAAQGVGVNGDFL